MIHPISKLIHNMIVLGNMDPEDESSGDETDLPEIDMTEEESKMEEVD